MTALATALLAAQKEMPAIEPDAENPHFKSKFVSLDHLLAVTLPVLNRHGITVIQLPSTLPDGAPGLTTILLHESGEEVREQMPLILPKNDPQGQGSALTYARRYALSAALGISGERDDDGEAATASVTAPEPQKRAKASSTPPKAENGSEGPADRGTKMRVRIQELAKQADTDRERSPGTTWAEVCDVIAWRHKPENYPPENPVDYGATWNDLTDDGCEWLGLELAHWLAAKDGTTFLEYVSLPF